MRLRGGTLGQLGPLLAALILIAAAALTAPAAQNEDAAGFSGMRWGSELRELQRTKHLTLTRANSADGTALYVLENEPLRFGTAILSGIHCSFVQQRLQGVLLLFQGEPNFAAMRSEAFARYGTSRQFGQNGEQMYNWNRTDTTIVLSYNPASQSGLLFLKPASANELQPGGSKAPRGPGSDQLTALDLLDQASEPPPEPASGVRITPEIEELLEQDQELTRLCWGTAGPETEAACRSMRENAARLQSLGMCMTAGTPGAGAQVIWHRCTDPPPPWRESDLERDDHRCRLVGELFAAAAQLREDGRSPQDAEQELFWQRSSQTSAITPNLIAEIVEQVYFDPSFAWSTQLSRQAEERCRRGHGPRPLP